MSQDLEDAVRNHLHNKAQDMRVPLSVGRPRRLARRRDQIRGSAAVLAALAAGVGVISIQKQPSDTIATASTVETPAPADDQSGILVWETAELPPGTTALDVVAVDDSFFLLTEDHQILQFTDGRFWTKAATQLPDTGATGIRSSDGVLIAWGRPADLPTDFAALPSVTRIFTSTDQAQTWQSSGTVGSPAPDQDPSPYVTASETVIDAAVVDNTLVVATAVGVSFDVDQVIADLELLNDGDTMSAVGSAMGESGIEIWLDGKSAEDPDVTLSPDELGMTDAEKEAVFGREQQGPYTAALGSDLQRINLGEVVVGIDSVENVNDEFVAGAFGNNGFEWLTSPDGLSWSRTGQTPHVESITTRDGVMYGTTVTTGEVVQSTDSGRTWIPIVALDRAKGRAWAGATGIVVIAESGSQFSSPPDPNNEIYWTTDGENWRSETMTDTPPEGSYPIAAIGADYIITVHRHSENGQPETTTTTIRIAQIPN